MAVSERAAWLEVKATIAAIRGAGKITRAKYLAATLEPLVDAMLDQVAGGVHANPPIVTYFNPPKGGELMSRRVYALEYQHVGDREDYRHDFSRGVDMIASRGVILLRRPDGKPLSKEFDV